jgi:hypothetical protein
MATIIQVADQCHGARGEFRRLVGRGKETGR